MDAFLTGVLAGYGIAIPVGAIAILIVEVGIRSGFRCAFFAGAGAASADFLYAGLAVIGGAALAELVESVDQPLRIISAFVLAAIAVAGLRRSGGSSGRLRYHFPTAESWPAPTSASFFSPSSIRPPWFTSPP